MYVDTVIEVCNNSLDLKFLHNQDVKVMQSGRNGVKPSLNCSQWSDEFKLTFFYLKWSQAKTLIYNQLDLQVA